MTAIVIYSVVIAASVGCSNTPEPAESERLTQGPVPEGYETWDDYWEDKDEHQRQVERRQIS